jgi:hypothetical protein
MPVPNKSSEAIPGMRMLVMIETCQVT